MNHADICALATALVEAETLPAEIAAAGKDKAHARAVVLMTRAVELGLRPLTGLSGLRFRSDGSIQVDTGHLAALLRQEGGRYAYDVLRRGPVEVLVQFRERDDEADRGFVVRCQNEGRCLPHRRRRFAEACKVCGGDNVWQTEIPAGWRWLGDVKTTLARARAEGCNVESEPWRKFPEGCLVARALREGARRFCPDVLPLGFGSIEEEETPQSAAAMEAEKPARQPKSSDESVTLTFIEQDIKARSVTRGDPIIDDCVDWRPEPGKAPDDVRRARWSDGSWVAWRYSHRATKAAGGEVRYKALDSWPSLPTDEAPSARELVKAALPERPPAGATEPKTQVLEPPGVLDRKDEPRPGGGSRATYTPDEFAMANAIIVKTIPPPNPVDQLSGGEGTPPSAPVGGEQGAVSEPPAPAAPGAGAPPAQATRLTDGSPVPVPGLECPECGSRVEVGVEAWETDTGIPAEEGCYVGCEMEGEGEEEHRYFQSDWQEVRDKATAWAVRALRRAVEPRSRCAECDAPLAADSEECPDPECPTNAGLSCVCCGEDIIGEPADEEDGGPLCSKCAGESARCGPPKLAVPSEEQVNVVSNVATAAEARPGDVSGTAERRAATARRELALMFSRCPKKKARSSKGHCRGCGQEVEGGDEFHEGLPVPAEGVVVKRRSSKPVGVMHVDCASVMSEGRDPREEGAEDAPEEQTT